jgi:membrane-associated phospholipid phosphatase
MNRKATFISIALLVATLLSVFFIDRPLAVWIETALADLRPYFTAGLSGLEIITGFTISKYLLAVLLIGGGILLFIKNRKSQLPFIFLFIGSVHFLSRIIAGSLKNVFDRTRPYQFLENNSIGDFFVDGGSSFPSGHVAHFFSLFIPLIFLFPRKWWWLLIVPVFVLLQRIIVNDHYLGDALASIFIVYLLTYFFHKVLTHYMPKKGE